MLDDFPPGAMERAEKVQRICEAADIDIPIYLTLKPLEDQARLYRQF